MRWLVRALWLSLLSAQTITTNEPTLVVCGSPGLLSVTVSNTTPNPMTGVQLAVAMPPGVLYQVGTVSAPATEVSVSPLNQPVFGLPNLNPAQSVTFTFAVQAGCGVIPFLADPNNEVKNTYTLTWSGGGSYTYTPAYEYTIQQPLLQYSSITNQTYTAPSAPATFTRTFTVTNAGDGRLGLFRHSETSGSGLIITGSSGGTVVSSGPHALTLELSGAQFASVGNGDAYLDPGESVTFTVTYQITSCTDLGSAFSLTWGCNSQTCQTVNESGGATVSASGLVPNFLTSGYAPNGNVVVITQESSCYQDAPGGASRVRLRFANVGTGAAYNVALSVFISDYPSDVYRSYMPARIDTTSLVVRIGATIQPRVITSASAGDPTPCFTAPDPVKYLTLQLPLVPAGETLYVEFDHYVCGLEACHGVTRPNIRSIGWSLSYKNACNDSYTASGGSNYRTQLNASLTNTHPGTVSDGQTFDVCVSLGEEPGNYTEYFVGNYVNSGGAPSSTGYYFMWVFQLPPGVVYTGGPVQWIGTQWNDPSITLSWPADNVVVSGSTVTVYFTHAGSSRRLANRLASWLLQELVCVPACASGVWDGRYGAYHFGRVLQSGPYLQPHALLLWDAPEHFYQRKLSGSLSGGDGVHAFQL